MRIVLDTNVVVSGLLWRGAPARVVFCAETGAIRLFSSAALLAELEGVLVRKQFQAPLRRLGIGWHELLRRFSEQVTVVVAPAIPPTIAADSDDDAVLACAVGARADAIVSGDAHLLSLKAFEAIPILTPTELLARV